MYKNNLARNTIMLTIGSVLTNLLLFIMIPFFSSWLTIEDYGTFDLILTYISLLLPIINLASGEALFRYSIDYDDLNKKKIFISNGLGIVIINMLLFTIILGIILIFKQKIIYISFYLLLVGQVLNSYFQSFLRGIKKLDIYSFSSTLSVIIISIAVTVYVKYLNLGLNGIILGYATGYLLGNIIIIFISKFWMYFSWKTISIKQMKYLINYSYPLIPNNISWWVMNASDRFIINIFLGSTYNGIFAIAHKIPSVCSSVFGMFNISWQETASDMVNAKDRNLYYNLIYNKTLSIVISLCIGILSLNFFLFNNIFDSKYYMATLYTPILISSILFSSMAQYFGAIMISFKNPKENGLTTLVGAICNIIVHIILVKFIGLYAAAISTLFSNFIVCLLRKNRLRKEITFKLEKETHLYIIIYLYYFFSSYININISFKIFNFITACILFIIINRYFIQNIIKNSYFIIRKVSIFK